MNLILSKVKENVSQKYFMIDYAIPTLFMVDLLIFVDAFGLVGSNVLG